MGTQLKDAQPREERGSGSTSHILFSLTIS
jgi:hypothetical protein